VAHRPDDDAAVHSSAEYALTLTRSPLVAGRHLNWPDPSERFFGPTPLSQGVARLPPLPLRTVRKDSNSSLAGGRETMAKSHLKLVAPGTVNRTVTPRRRPNAELRRREYRPMPDNERAVLKDQ
jgi:hypothetical protein